MKSGFLGAVISIFGITAAACPAIAGPVSGEAVYQKRCGPCHDSTSARVPPRDVLRKLPAARILRALDFRGDDERRVANDPGGTRSGCNIFGVAGADAAPSPKNYCADRNVNLTGIPKGAWNGWSPTTENTRYPSADAAGLSLDQVRRLKLKWPYGFEGDVNAIGAPAVIGPYLFAGSAGGAVQALDVRSGCVHWMFQAGGPVRSAMLAVPLDNSGRHALMFSDLTGWYYSRRVVTGLDPEVARQLDDLRLTSQLHHRKNSSARYTGRSILPRSVSFALYHCVW